VNDSTRKLIIEDSVLVRKSNGAELYVVEDHEEKLRKKKGRINKD
jgi:hypothetical protein